MIGKYDANLNILLDYGNDVDYIKLFSLIHWLRNGVKALTTAERESFWLEVLSLPLHMVKLEVWKESLLDALTGREAGCLLESFIALTCVLSGKAARALHSGSVYRLVEVLKAVLSSGFLLEFEQSRFNSGQEFWIKILRRLVHVPDKLSNILRQKDESGPTWWTSELFAEMLARELVAYYDRSPDKDFVPAISAALLSLLVLNGAANSVAKPLLLSFTLGHGFYPVVCFDQRTFEKLSLSFLNLVSNFRVFAKLSAAERGQLLRSAVVGDSTTKGIDDAKLRWLLEILPSTEVLSLSSCKVIVRCYSFMPLHSLSRTMGALLANFNDRFFLSNAAFVQLQSQVRIMLLCLSLLTAEELVASKVCWTSLILSCTSKFLDLTVRNTRCLCLALAEALSNRLDISPGSDKLDFELDSTSPVVQECRRLCHRDIWLEPISPTEDLPSSNRIREPPMPSPISQPLATAAMQSDSDDEDPEFTPFSLEEDGRAPTVKQLLPPGTLAELVAFTKPLPGPSNSANEASRRSGRSGLPRDMANNPHLDAERLELAVDNGKRLIGQATTFECESHCEDIVKRFSNASDDFGIAEFYDKVGGILTEICIRCPIKVAPMLASGFYSRNVLHLQRIRMLDALANAALQLSNKGGARLDVDKSKGMKVEAIMSPVHKLISGIAKNSVVKRPESLRKLYEKQKTVKNLFASLVEYFFWPLLNGWYQEECFVRDNLLLNPENLFLLEKLIATLALLVYCSAHSPIVSDALTEFWRFVNLFRGLQARGSAYMPLKRVLIFSLNVLAAVYPTWLLKEREHRVIFQMIGSWAADLVNEEQDAENLKCLLRLTKEIESKNDILAEDFWGRDLMEGSL